MLSVRFVRSRCRCLFPSSGGAPYRVNLTEKLLVLAPARLFNYIPEAGLWTNTQRPEWNGDSRVVGLALPKA